MRTYCGNKMQFTPILICLVVLSIAQAALVTSIPSPKLNSVLTQKLKIPDIPNLKSPEERRKFSLFPKSYMKYVISPELIYKTATHRPPVQGTKKPLMKKLNQLSKKKNVVENEGEQLIVNAKPKNESNLAVNPKEINVVVSQEAIIETVEDKSEESNEKQNDDSEEENKLEEVMNFFKNSNEFETKTTDSDKKETRLLKIIKLIPVVIKPIQFNAENKNFDVSADVIDIKKNSEEIETPEFILGDPIHKPTDSVMITSEGPEEFVTTEFYAEPKIVRSKRGSNVIEEENLASTVAGYKYTWKDTRLNNDVAFKNIHS